jgi:STE24 endopeptidase
MNMLSRKNEYQADAFAAINYKPEALASSLKKLSVKNLSNLTPHSTYVFFHYSHPPLLQRLAHLKQFENI